MQSLEYIITGTLQFLKSCIIKNIDAFFRICLAIAQPYIYIYVGT